MTKAELRKEIKEKLNKERDSLTLLSKKVCEVVKSSAAFNESQLVLGYMALWDEVDISEVLDFAVKQGKTVYIPRIIPETNKMDFFEYNPQDIKKGSFGINEPQEAENKFELKKYNQKILVLVPGRAFTKQGDRLGRGKGFYDLFLSELKKLNSDNSIFAGVCFDLQLTEEIPTEAHDLRMDVVFSS